MAAIQKTFQSKITYWIYVPLVGVFVFIFVKSIIDKAWIGTGVSALVWGLIVFPVLLNTRYTITDSVLNVRSGFLINNNIEIGNIRSIKPTNAFWSSPALSFDRIEIFYNRYDSIIISPKHKQEFIQTLKQINPSIVSEV